MFNYQQVTEVQEKNAKKKGSCGLLASYIRVCWDQKRGCENGQEVEEEETGEKKESRARREENIRGEDPGSV